MPSLPKKITCNDQTFYIDGKPHQLIQHNNGLYSVCKIEENTMPYGKGLVRVKTITGTLRECTEWIDDEIRLANNQTNGDNIRELEEKYWKSYLRMRDSSIDLFHDDPKAYALLDLKTRKFVIEQAIKGLTQKIDEYEKEKGKTNDQSMQNS